MITLEELRRSHFRPTLFVDGASGSFSQIHRCVEHPRLVKVVSRGRPDQPIKTMWFVDDREAETLEQAVELMNGGEVDPSEP